MQVFLIRHPRPLLDADVCYGQRDLAAEDPLPLAARLRELLPVGTPVISSPLQRARKLACALHPAPTFDARLLEIDFGDWEGRRWDDIERQQLDAWAADVLHFAPPGGESVANLLARVVDFAATLAGERVALVSHSGVMRALLGHWLQLPLAEWSALQFDFARATLIELNGKATLRYMNR